MYTRGFRDVRAVKNEMTSEGIYCKKRALREGRSEEGLEGMKCEIHEPISDVLGVFLAKDIRGAETLV